MLISRLAHELNMRRVITKQSKESKLTAMKDGLGFWTTTGGRNKGKDYCKMTSFHHVFAGCDNHSPKVAIVLRIIKKPGGTRMRAARPWQSSGGAMRIVVPENENQLPSPPLTWPTRQRRNCITHIRNTADIRTDILLSTFPGK